MSELDEIDIKLLKEIDEKPGQSLADAMQALLKRKRRSQRTLYDRLFALEMQQFISVDRSSERGLARATITEKGKAAITGRENPLPTRQRGESS
mgnify:FL=1